MNVQHRFLLSMTMSVLCTTHAVAAEIAHSAQEVVGELGVSCQKLEVAPQACVISYFSVNEDNVWTYQESPSQVYRVLLGKRDDGQYVGEDYHSNGQLQSDAFVTSSIEDMLRDGDGASLIPAKDGLYKRWFANGQLDNQETIVNGQVDGLVSFWNMQGTLVAQGKQSSDAYQGLWQYWYDNGTKWADEHYTDNQLDGLVKTWSEQGQLIDRLMYRKGEKQGMRTTWYENGQKRSVGPYKNDMMSGAWVFWHDNGRKWAQGKFENDEAIGQWQFWDEQGRPESSGEN